MIRYTPRQNYFGADTLSYRIFDHAGNPSNEAAVTLTVAAIDDPPIAGDDGSDIHDCRFHKNKTFGFTKQSRRGRRSYQSVLALDLIGL